MTRGKYVIVWKKQEDGQWKVVADIANPDAPPRRARGVTFDSVRYFCIETMTLTSGTRLGMYEVTAQIGQGGMAAHSYPTSTG